METILVIYSRQDLVDVGFQYHASHDYLIKNVVDLKGNEGSEGGMVFNRVQTAGFCGEEAGLSS